MNNSIKIVDIENMDELNDCCKGRRIWLYGAGKHSELLYDFLDNYGFEICGFLVTNKGSSTKEKLGKSILTAATYKENKTVVLWAINGGKQMCMETVPQNIDLIYYVKKEMLEAYFLDRVKTNFPENYSIEKKSAESDHAIIKYEDDKGKVIFRIHFDMLTKMNIGQLKDMSENLKPYQSFERLFGRFFYLNSDSGCDRLRRSYSVYMARCHVDKTRSLHQMPEWIIPIQVGTELTDIRLCDIRDNTGDNISTQNRAYSECTAIYWMWKNAPKTDYIGLCHYRRHFAFRNGDISVIENNDYDIVTVIPELSFNNEKFFEQYVTKEDLTLLKSTIWERFPDYYETAQAYYETQFALVCNMFVMKYDIFMDYVAFAFGVTERIDSFYRRQNIVRNDRYLGYLMEMLTGIYIAHNSDKYKIGYADMEFIDAKKEELS